MVDDIRGSVTQLIADLQVGDVRDAQQEIWDALLSSHRCPARQKLGNSPRGCEDEEDVALSALDSFFRGVANNRFPKLRDRDNLWALLATLTRQGHQSEEAANGAQRGGRECKLTLDMPDWNQLQELIDDEIGPEFIVAIQDECRQLMEALADDRLRQIAAWKLEGWTNAEVARELGVAERTVERKLELIRSIWSIHEPLGP